MEIFDLIYSIIINAIPLAIFAIPLIIIRKKLIGKIYSRFFYGLCVFFLVYWVLPSLFQTEVSVLGINTSDQGNVGLGIQYILIRSIALVVLYLQYPFVLLPFVFIVAPFISFIIFRNRIKKEPGSMEEKLAQLNYEFNKSPKDVIIESLNSKDWNKEKDLFKGFLILLPISLYLLTVILDISHENPVNIAESSTALGWFIEILFVYLASFLMGFELVKSSKISFNGRFIGEQIQTKFFSSLTEVGTPIAILSLVLFIAQKTQSLLLILFFFGYFIMAAFTFIMFIRIFEPLSILFFIKIINFWKMKTAKKYSVNLSNIVNSAILGLLATIIIVMINLVKSVLYDALIQMVAIPEGILFNDLVKINAQPSFEVAFLMEVLSAFDSIFVILNTLAASYLLYLAIRQERHIFLHFLIFSIIMTIMSVIFGYLISMIFMIPFDAAMTLMPMKWITDMGWQTGTPVILSQVFNFNFITMRTALLSADLSNSWLLFILSIPFQILRQVLYFLLWGLFFLFIKKEFRSEKAAISEKTISRTTYSNLTEMVSLEQLKVHGEYLISNSIDDIPAEEPKELRDFFQSLKPITAVEKFLKITNTDFPRIYDMLKYLSRKRFIQWWIPEFGYTYEKADLRGLYTLYTDGRDLFYHNFKKGAETIEPALVSGMFSAITSFIQEATKSSELLRTIDNGDIKVLLEYSKKYTVFCALFADRESTDIRTALQGFLHEFEARHSKVLGNWNGDMSYFKGTEELVPKYFGDFI